MVDCNGRKAQGHTFVHRLVVAESPRSVKCREKAFVSVGRQRGYKTLQADRVYSHQVDMHMRDRLSRCWSILDRQVQ